MQVGPGRRRWRLALVGLALLGLSGAGGPLGVGADSALTGDLPEAAGGKQGGRQEPPDGPGLPVLPRPQQLELGDGSIPVPRDVQVLAGPAVDRASTALLVQVLESAGARGVDVETLGRPRVRKAALTVTVGALGDDRVVAALRTAGGRMPADLPAEGYVLASRASPGGDAVVLAGVDSAGTYYAVQTLRQLAGRQSIRTATVVDYPLMRLRGAIEGFYGRPWTHAERMDQLAFYGQLKLNTYIYAPKDDPYHRGRWRESYPAAKLAELGELVDQARSHHVRFTFALSPGVSICYSDPGDRRALEAKLQAVYDLGVRTFSIPLDDIDYTRWNCARDGDRYGEPSAQSAARAQVDLLNAVQQGFLDSHTGTHPLQMVPTEYGDLAETPYKATIRQDLDRRVEVMWTGTAVVPPRITVAEAGRAAALWGRKVFVWDNYPVNDYDRSVGRLFLAPYSNREPGLHRQLSGIVLNPMNQAAASKVALTGGADFTWHDRGYDAAVTARHAAAQLAGGDEATTAALAAFFDVEHLIPTFGEELWQPQAPELSRRLARFRAAWARADKEAPPSTDAKAKVNAKAAREAKAAAIGELRPYAHLLADAPTRIRAGVADRAFVEDCAPWLDALDLWGEAFVRTLDGLQARVDGDGETARRSFAEAEELAGKAERVTTIPGETRPQGQVRVGDGVLDAFLAQAAARAGPRRAYAAFRRRLAPGQES
ncbi:beta-N-acetylglucosaminidase domain-containing protein [Actinopolymorpha sp. B17G11]|uniref:beta-N-acetylhexosaminidase family protein n=1 Tax=Actinopolymorpha sp. B17G11 TaxID=3160861 RepID=UPI0032E4FF3D